VRKKMSDDADLKALKSELHHWWPRALSRFWADSNGAAHWLRPDGRVIPATPHSFGAITNDNHIRLSAEGPTVWDETFEPSYGSADSTFPHLIDWLQTLSSANPPSEAAMEHRLTPVLLTDDRRVALAECLASLIMRSPSFRFVVRLGIEGFRRDVGMREPKAEHSLIGLNIRHGQKMLSAAIARHGKFGVLLSGDQEFIFGDGFLHNISSIANPPFNPRCLIPLTPEIAIFYVSPISYRSFPKAFVLNLKEEEVACVNRTVQVYAAQSIFFRRILPSIDPWFQQGKHAEFQGHSVPWLDNLGAVMADGYFGNDTDALR